MDMEKPTRTWLHGILLVVGVVGVAYGMTEENHPVFILGLLIGIAGYLLIRRELKDSSRKKS